MLNSKTPLLLQNERKNNSHKAYQRGIAVKELLILHKETQWDDLWPYLMTRKTRNNTTITNIIFIKKSETIYSQLIDALIGVVPNNIILKLLPTSSFLRKLGELAFLVTEIAVGVFAANQVDGVVNPEIN